MLTQCRVNISNISGILICTINTILVLVTISYGNIDDENDVNTNALTRYIIQNVLTHNFQHRDINYVNNINTKVLTRYIL